MRLFFACVALAFSAGVASGAYAAFTTPSQEEFVKKASLSNLFEIESSKLAQQRASKQEVKDFAAKMIKDHEKAGEDLKAAVRRSNLDSNLVAAALDEAHREKMISLNKESAEDFDETYMEMQENAHDDAVALFEDYAENGDNTILRDFASKTLPTLKQHERMTDELD